MEDLNDSADLLPTEINDSPVELIAIFMFEADRLTMTYAETVTMTIGD